MIDLKKKNSSRKASFEFFAKLFGFKDGILKSGKNHINSCLREKYFTMI